MEGLFLAMLEFIADIVGWMTIKTSHSTTLDGLDSGYRDKRWSFCSNIISFFAIKVRYFVQVPFTLCHRNTLVK